MTSSYDPNMVPVEYIVVSNYVKYNRLDELIAHAFSGSDATSINIYIDLYGIHRTLLSRSYRTNIDDSTVYTSSLINMCGHYRSFFKHYGVHTKIFLISGYNTCEYNMRLVSGYNQISLDKQRNTPVLTMIEQNNKLLEVLTPFLEDIYFLKTEFETSVLIDYLIRNGDGNPNIVISKDIYPSQLTFLHASTSYLKPKKLNGADISVIIPPIENISYLEDFWMLFSQTKNLQSYSTVEKLMGIHPMNMTMLGALNKFEPRCMKMVVNLTQAIKLIHDTVGSDPIQVHTDSIIQTNMKRKEKDQAALPEQIILNRHHALDVTFMRKIYEESVECKMIHLQNLTDPESVRAICAEYFTKSPIDLGLL